MLPNPPSDVGRFEQFQKQGTATEAVVATESLNRSPISKVCLNLQDFKFD